MPLVIKLLAAALVAAGLMVGPAAHATPTRIADKADRAGDVSVQGNVDGIDPAIVDSIDLRHVTVTRQAHGVRVVVRLKQVLPARGRWIQGIELQVTPPSWAVPGWFFFAAV